MGRYSVVRSYVQLTNRQLYTTRSLMHMHEELGYKSTVQRPV
jgi:hypothetical protein